MGAGASAETNRHSRLYYEGYRALQEGRYTYAEIYYEQAIERHEGHAFWASFGAFNEAERKMDKGDRKKVEAKSEASTTLPTPRDTRQASSQEEQQDQELDELKEGKDVVKPTRAEFGGEGEKGLEGSGEVLEFPLDSRLVTVLDYLQLRADISDSYLTAGRYDDASPHVEYISANTEAAMRCLQIAREQTIAGDDSGGSVNPLDNINTTAAIQRRQRLAMSSADPERESILDCLDQYFRLHWVSSTVNGVYIAFERFRGGQGEKKRKKELDAAVVTCLHVVEALFNYARRRAKSLTNAVVLNFLDALIEDMDADSCSSESTDHRSKHSKGKGKGKMSTSVFEESIGKSINTGVPNKSLDDRSLVDAPVLETQEETPMAVRLQVLPDRRLMCRSVPAPQQGPSLRHVPWMDEEIRRVVPGTNHHLEIQCGMVDDKRKKQLQRRALKFVVQTRCDYNDRVRLGKSFDEENALLLFPVLMIQADVQLELGAATKGIQALDMVDKLATQLYGMDSLERQSLMRRVTESRKRGGALFMMFED